MSQSRYVLHQVDGEKARGRNPKNSDTKPPYVWSWSCSALSGSTALMQASANSTKIGSNMAFWTICSAFSALSMVTRRSLMWGLVRRFFTSSLLFNSCSRSADISSGDFKFSFDFSGLSCGSSFCITSQPLARCFLQHRDEQ